MNPYKRGAALVLAAAATSLISLQASGAAPLQQFSPFNLATPVTEVNSTAADGCPIESPDGLSLFFASARPNDVPGSVGNDIWVSDRESLTSPWQAPKNLGAPINSVSNDFCPTPVGRSLFFVSERPDNGTGIPPCGGGDIYLSRQSPAGGWSTPVMLDCAPKGPNFIGQERSPSLVETWFGTFLFYSSNGDGGDQDIYMSQMGADGKFGPGKVVKELSSDYEDIMPNVRARDDGSFEIVFSSNRPVKIKGQLVDHKQDIYISYAWYPTAKWTPPRNLGDAVNTATGVEQRATLSADGKRMYFGRDGEIYVSQRPGRH
jgi:hypothetical protein